MGDFIPTRGSRVKQEGPVEGFISINYETRKKKPVTSLDSDTKPVSTVSHDKTVKNNDKHVDPRRAQELEMKRARYDVIKFGMSGFQGTKIKEAKVVLAVSLGAKPPKNPNINYKKLLEQQREERIKKAKEPVLASGLKKSLVKYKTKSKKSSGILGIYGKVQKDVVSRNKK